MAKITEEITAQFQTTTDSDIEETHFQAGDEVEIVETWKRHYLVRDSEGHYYNLPKDKVEP